jgi:hypothetical protein
MAAAPLQIPSSEARVPARVGLTRDQVMTASEVAELLHMPVSTVYYLARLANAIARRDAADDCLRGRPSVATTGSKAPKC